MAEHSRIYGAINDNDRVLSLVVKARMAFGEGIISSSGVFIRFLNSEGE